MDARKYYFSLLTFIGSLTLGFTASAQSLDSITLDARGLTSGAYTWDTPGARIDESLDLGDEIYGGTLKLTPEGGQGDEYRVRVQFETSLGISGEGPHVDLIDFRHCVSEWHVASSDDGRSFTGECPRRRGLLALPVHGAASDPRARW